MSSTGLHKIKHADLKKFVKSEVYKGFTQKPLSQERIASYLANPNARPDDHILYYLQKNGELIAYRSILPDNYHGKTPEHFGWLSGNWVHPDHRRQGHSGRLLEAVLIDWDHKLMYSNFAPESHALYQKSGKFREISTRRGYGFYLYARPSRLYRMRAGAFKKLLLPFGDIAFAVAAVCKRLFLRPPAPGCEFTLLKEPSETFYREFENRHVLGFERGRRELEWIIQYPWIREGGEKQAYYFSHRAGRFYYRFILMKEQEETCGFAMLQYRDGSLQIPYFQLGDGGHEAMAAWLVRYCRRNFIRQMIIYDPVLSEAVAMHKKHFVYHKRKTQKIYASWQPSGFSPLAADGDGDYVFS